MRTEEVVAELPQLGRFKVRIVKNGTGCRLDIREWIENEDYVGFTRKGIRLKPSEVVQLIESLQSQSESIEFLKSAAGGDERAAK